MKSGNPDARVRVADLTSAISMLFMLIALTGTTSSAQPLAFPGADGFGKFTTGGRGGAVHEVVSLDDSGPGSLRAAVEATGPRTVVFRVSGTITLRSNLEIEHGDLTIAGQTAPGDGICVRNYPTIIKADNIIIRFMRFRLGDVGGQAEDAMMALGQRDIIIDHCSFSWGIDEVATFYNNENFTLQWCIISESLDNSLHPKGTHGYGAIWGGYRASFHHNLLAHNSSRNPRFQGGRWAGWEDKEEADFRNNVVFNWGFECIYGGESGKYNIVANYFKSGPATLHPSSFLSVSDTESSWYIADNEVHGYPEISKDNRKGVREKDVAAVYSDIPFLHDIAAYETAADAYNAVLAHAGAYLPARDTVDRRVLSEVSTGTAAFGDDSYAIDHRSLKKRGPMGIINSQSSVGGWPELRSTAAPQDSDHDGMPDSWEDANNLDKHSAKDGALLRSSGYTHLETYLNELAEGQ